MESDDGSDTDLPVLFKGKAKTKKAKAPTEASNKPVSVYDFVFEAIESMGGTRKGISVPAIKKYVHSKKEMNEKRLNTLINKALLKGLGDGTFKKPLHMDIAGATGSFLLAKKTKQTKKLDVRKPDNTGGYASDSETATTSTMPKPRKRTLSDSVIEKTPKPPRRGKMKILKAVSADVPHVTKKPNKEEVKANIAKKTNMEEAKASVKKKTNNEEANATKKPKKEEGKANIAKKTNTEEAKASVQKKTNNEEANANATKKTNKEKGKANIAKKANTEEAKANVKKKANNEEGNANVTKKANMKEPKRNIEKKTTGKKQKAAVEREDSSDSEFVINKGGKSIKLYSSDTDIDSVFVDTNLFSTPKSRNGEKESPQNTKVVEKAKKLESSKASKTRKKKT